MKVPHLDTSCQSWLQARRQKESKQSQMSSAELIILMEVSFLLQVDSVLAQILQSKLTLQLSIVEMLWQTPFITSSSPSLIGFAEVYFRYYLGTSLLLQDVKVKAVLLVWGGGGVRVGGVQRRGGSRQQNISIFVYYNFIEGLAMLVESYRQFMEPYRQFIAHIADISFSRLEATFLHFSNTHINRYLPKYVPKLFEYNLQLDQHQKQEEKMKKTASFDGKRSYNNNDNLHRRVIGCFKDFLLSQHKDFKQFLRLTVDIDQLSTILSRIQILRFRSQEYNLIYYLFTSGRKSMRIYLKLREAIVKTNSFEKEQFLPISIHNKAKYAQKYIYLDAMSIPSAQWKQIINLAGFEYDDEFVKFIFDNKPNVSAVQIIEYCLWLNQEYDNKVNSPNSNKY